MAAAAVPAIEFAPGTAEIDGAAVVSDLETTAAGLIRSLQLSQQAVPYQHPPS